MTNYKFDEIELLQQTDGGLQIIHYVYPSSSSVAIGKKFKVRDQEKSASASIKRLDDGIYIVTDFGGDGKPRNGVACYMFENGLTNKGEACKQLYEIFNLASGQAMSPPVTHVEFRPATDEQKEGDFNWIVKEDPTNEDLQTIFVKSSWNYLSWNSDRKISDGDQAARTKALELLKSHNWVFLESFTRIKNRKAIITTSGLDYPIIMIDCGSFQKIYQPKNPDKKYRFQYNGEKPKDYIFGLELIEKKFKALNDNWEQSKKSESTDPEAVKTEAVPPPKLKSIVMCSGDRDSMNVAALGFDVIWRNSESADLDHKTYNTISSRCDQFYNLPDIDLTGKKKAVELGLKFLELKTIWLPKQLSEFKDFRGNHCKDVTDYLRHFMWKDFLALINGAMSFQFWTVTSVYEKNKNRWVKDVDISRTQLYYFLEASGFYRMRLREESDESIYIHNQNNIIKEIFPNEIKNYVHRWIAEKNLPIDVRDRFYKASDLNSESLANLPITDFNFIDTTKDSQLLFFKNKVWEITADEIKEHKNGDINNYVWSDEVLKHQIRKLPDMFQVTRDPESKKYSIEILNKECKFFQVLIRTSQVYWRKELELQEPLTEAEKYEQDVHLINKMYCLGYLLHRYKDPSRPWIVYGTDAKLSDDNSSNGGSGKSFVFKALTLFMKQITLDGRNPKLADNSHIFENVDKHTDLIFIDDVDKKLNLQVFYSIVTGSMTVNPKGTRSFNIKEAQVPKIAITSNYPPSNQERSTLRRLLFSVFSDYFHVNTDGEYKEDRTIKDEFGKNLLQDDYTEHEWNLFYNFMGQCVKLYLNFDKIEVESQAVVMRTHMASMGLSFKEWADVYFTSEGDPNEIRVDKHISRKDAAESFKIYDPKAYTTSHNFKKKLQHWCDFNGYVLNPKDLISRNDGRLLQGNEEMIHIRTNSLQPGIEKSDQPKIIHQENYNIHSKNS